MSDSLTLFDADDTPVPFDGLGLTGAVSPATALLALPRIKRASAAVRWLHGDLVLALIEGDLSRLHEAFQQIAELDLDDRPSLMRSIHVAASVPRSRRRPLLSWSHHQAVAGLDAEEQDEWLQRAEDDALTVHALEHAIAAENAPADDPPLFDSPRPWRLPAEAAQGIGNQFRSDPGCAVILRADGSWRVFGEAS